MSVNTWSFLTGDLVETVALDAWLAGCEVLVWTASMGFGHVPEAVLASRKQYTPVVKQGGRVPRPAGGQARRG